MTSVDSQAFVEKRCCSLGLTSWDGSSSRNASDGELTAVNILDLSKVAWTCWGCFYTSSGLGLRMVNG